MSKDQLVYRQNMKFHVNESKIKPQFRRVDIINGLYVAIYEEFKGAIHNSKYSHMSAAEKLQEVNKFAQDWLSIRGFI